MVMNLIMVFDGEIKHKAPFCFANSTRKSLYSHSSFYFISFFPNFRHFRLLCVGFSGFRISFLKNKTSFLNGGCCDVNICGANE